MDNYCSKKIPGFHPLALNMLQNKTVGNLTNSEKAMIEGLLHDLRMQYVALTNPTQKPRAFTGSDITGGR